MRGSYPFTDLGERRNVKVITIADKCRKVHRVHRSIGALPTGFLNRFEDPRMRRKKHNAAAFNCPRNVDDNWGAWFQRLPTFFLVAV